MTEQKTTLDPDSITPEILATRVRHLVEKDDITGILTLEEVCAVARSEAEERVRRTAERKVTAARMAGR